MVVSKNCSLYRREINRVILYEEKRLKKK